MGRPQLLATGPSEVPFTWGGSSPGYPWEGCSPALPSSVSPDLEISLGFGCSLGWGKIGGVDTSNVQHLDVDPAEERIDHARSSAPVIILLSKSPESSERWRNADINATFSLVVGTV